MKKITLSPHAAQRLEERNISMVEIVFTIKKPGHLIESFQHRKITVKQIENEKRHVVYIEEEEEMVVITVY